MFDLAFTEEYAVLRDAVFIEEFFVIVYVSNTEAVTATRGLTFTDDEDVANTWDASMILAFNSALSDIIVKSFKDERVFPVDINNAGTGLSVELISVFDEFDETNMVDCVKSVKSLFDRICRETVVDVAGWSLVIDKWDESKPVQLCGTSVLEWYDVFLSHVIAVI